MASRLPTGPSTPDDVVNAMLEAAVLPGLWPGALDRLAAHAACESGVLVATDGSPEPVLAANDAALPALHKYNAEGWAMRNTQGPRTLAYDEPSFISDYDIFTPEEVEQDAFYRDFLRPTGLAWGCGTAVLGPTENRIIISLHRRLEHGPLARTDTDRMTAIRPALARGAFLASRLRLQEARNTVNALDMVGLPAAALTLSGRLSAANASFQRFIPTVALDQRDRIHLRPAAADRLLAAALARRRVRIADGGTTIPIAAGDERPPLVLHLIPVAGQAHDVFSALDWLLLAIPVETRPSVGPQVLQGLFDLTPAEARVARGLLDGHALPDLAGRASVSVETVRSQLKTTLAKMGVTRQTELVRLLTGIPALDEDGRHGR